MRVISQPWKLIYLKIYDQFDSQCCLSSSLFDLCTWILLLSAFAIYASMSQYCEYQNYANAHFRSSKYVANNIILINDMIHVNERSACGLHPVEWEKKKEIDKKGWMEMLRSVEIGSREKLLIRHIHIYIREIQRIIELMEISWGNWDRHLKYFSV